MGEIPSGYLGAMFDRADSDNDGCRPNETAFCDSNINSTSINIESIIPLGSTMQDIEQVARDVGGEHGLSCGAQDVNI